MTPLAIMIFMALIVINDSTKSLAAIDLWHSAKKGGLVELSDPLLTLQTAFKGKIPFELMCAPILAVGLFNIVLLIAIFKKGWTDSQSTR